MKTKSTKAKREEWHRQACAFLEGAGARRLPESLWPEFELETQAGRLCVGVHGSKVDCFAWLSCRFDNVDAARQLLAGDNRLNPYSGKWNFLYNWSDPCLGIQHFAAQLRRVMPSTGQLPDNQIDQSAK